MAYVSKNLSKEKREKVLDFLKQIKDNVEPSDSEKIAKISMVENYIDTETYGLVFEQHSEEVFDKLTNEVPVFKIDDTRTIINDNTGMNFIIEGDNLHALHLLSKTHKHSLDMIYIDPPYNTGAKDWKYNNRYVDKTDGYRHSLWLSMMSTRLKIAKNLLKETGVLVCAIDENELATVSLLLEDTFSLDYKIDTICVVHNPRGVQGDNFSYVNEYALFVYKKGLKAIEDTKIEKDEVEWSQFRNWGDESERSDAKNCFYPIYVDKDLNIIGHGEVPADDFHPDQTIFNEEYKRYEIYPIDLSGVERKWRYATQSFHIIESMLKAKKGKDNRIEIMLGRTFGSYKTVWSGKKYDANTYGTQLINDMVPTNDFDFPKSLYTVYECLDAVVRNKPNAIILDFFAGSGTTGHAVLLMNKLLGGNRHFILCTNNAIGEKKEKEFIKSYPDLVNKEKEINTSSQEYKDWEVKYGIARSVTYPRIKAAINGYTTSKGTKTIVFEKKLKPSIFLDSKKYQKLHDEINKIISAKEKEFDDVSPKIEDEYIRIYASTSKNTTVQGLGGNLSYFKTTFVPKNTDSEELRDRLMNHIKEMIYLKEMKFVSDNFIILDDDQLLNVMNNISNYRSKTIYVSPYVLFGSTDKKQLTDNGISYYEIPDVFFEKELRKVGEL